MRAFHASLLPKGQARRQEPREDRRRECQVSRFVVGREGEGKEERERERENAASCAKLRLGRLMTKYTGSKHCIPRHFRRLFCESRNIRHGMRRFQQRGMQSPFDRSLILRNVNRNYKGLRQTHFICKRAMINLNEELPKTF